MNPVRPSSSPPKAPSNRADFQPESQWTDEAAASVLTIKLPGFNKDQLKITFDESTRNLRVQGKRRVPNNNRLMSQFNRDFEIPENCKLNEMKAKFDQNQVLTITMPKKTTTTTTILSDHQKPPRQEDTTTTRPPQRPSSNVETDHLLPSPKKLTQKEETAPKKTEDNEKRTPTPTWRDPLGHIKSPPQDTSYASPKPKATTNASIGKQNVEEALQPPSPPQRQQLSKPKSQKDIAPSNYNDDQITSKLPGQSNTKAKGGSVDELQKENEKNKVKAADDLSSSSMLAGGSFLEKTGDLAAVAKRAVLGLDEERQLLVNAGVAVLVIAALGVYVSYKFGSSGSGKRKD